MNKPKTELKVSSGFVFNEDGVTRLTLKNGDRYFVEMSSAQIIQRAWVERKVEPCKHINVERYTKADFWKCLDCGEIPQSGPGFVLLSCRHSKLSKKFGSRYICADCGRSFDGDSFQCAD